MKKKTLVYLIVLLFQFSCNSSKTLKKYGVITSEIDSAASIDTTHEHRVTPITMAFRHFKLKNQSTDRNIVFVCKCTCVNDDGSVLGNTEEHTVGPQEMVKLNHDSTFYYHIINMK